MFHFKKRHAENNKRDDRTQEVTVEVQSHKNETLKAIEETKQATDTFNRLLKKNGITLKIHIATGGRK